MFGLAEAFVVEGGPDGQVEIESFARSLDVATVSNLMLVKTEDLCFTEVRCTNMALKLPSSTDLPR